MVFVANVSKQLILASPFSY